MKATDDGLGRTSREVVDVAMKIHSALGPGLLESAYQACLVHELRARGLPVLEQVPVFESLGFSFNPQFTDATGTCMLIGEDAYFMLLARERFAGFSKRPVGDPRSETSALFAISVNSREEVDAMVKKAVAAGGSHAVDPQDHGFMYGWSFYDLDGHHWEVFWMDPAALQG